MGESQVVLQDVRMILLIGALAIGGKGINLGIDFVGGTQIERRSSQASERRAVLVAAGMELRRVKPAMRPTS